MTEHIIQTHPVLPLRDIVVFPHMIVPLFVGREKSIRALDEVMSDDKKSRVAAQKEAHEDDAVRVVVITTRGLDYVIASRAFGATHWHVMTRVLAPFVRFW